MPPAAQIPPLQPIQSSNLMATGFDNQSLYVRFKGGGLWRYTPIAGQLPAWLSTPQQAEARLRAEPSPGGFFHKEIKGGAWTAERVQESQKE